MDANFWKVVSDELQKIGVGNTIGAVGGVGSIKLTEGEDKDKNQQLKTNDEMIGIRKNGKKKAKQEKGGFIAAKTAACKKHKGKAKLKKVMGY